MGTFFFRRAMLGGGVCSRMSRFSRVTAAIEGSRARGAAPVLYVHPWELDDEHPAMRLSPLGTLVHFAGRRRVVPRLSRLLAAYELRPIGSLLAKETAAPREPASDAVPHRPAAA